MTVGIGGGDRKHFFDRGRGGWTIIIIIWGGKFCLSVLFPLRNRGAVIFVKKTKGAVVFMDKWRRCNIFN